MNSVAVDILMHYGMPRRSGRYPWGSGKNPYQHSGDFLARVDELKGQGLSDKEIADALGLTTTQYRVQKSLAKNERRADLVATAKGLREKGYSLNEIADKMGYNNDSSVRALLNENTESRMNKAKTTADFLKQMVDDKGMVDVGTGVERELGISKEKMKEALEMLKMEGYEVYGGGIPQVTNPGKQTNVKVLCPPGTEHKEIYNFDNIHSVKDYDKMLIENGERIKPAFEYPESMSSKRLMINYATDDGKGGALKDGVIELRRGVDDLSLGNSHYAQVRILVDGDHYLKGMAVYADDLPDGIDVRFNTNKKAGTPTEKVLKEITNDPNNPFGSLIKEHGGQSYYIGKDGKEHLSLINKRAEEGDWGEWADKLPSQFLSKQNMNLINKQLNLATADKVDEFDEIKSLTNPTIKRHLLNAFANDCDASAVHLKAAALPNQKYQVLLPLKSIKDSEVYAPNYDDGEKIALIRYPHGGTFEIPILTVNTKNKEGKNTIGANPKDAIGISKKVADQLSGADFDGDTVMVIPLRGKTKITATPHLKELKDFDPKDQYGPDSTTLPYKRMSKGQTQKEMGVISNLITDMTLRGANESEIARAVKHSMVVIDANKHNLDYQRSAKDNGIAALKKKYQGHYDDEGSYHEGASTLISRAKSQVSVPKRQGSPIVNDDGSLSWKTSDNLYYTNKKTGKTEMRKQKSTQMAETKDAYTLSSGTKQENAYAEYANRMKSLANQARKEAKNTGNLKYSASAKATYQAEVDSLNAQLNIALKNAPRERQAQAIANSVMAAKKEAYPDLTKKEIKKMSQQALTEARIKVGAKRNPIEINDREWEAIQAGAITDSKLQQILNHTDVDKLRQRATPRTTTALSKAKISRIKSMAASDYTNAEIAKALGISSSTVVKYL